MVDSSTFSLTPESFTALLKDNVFVEYFNTFLLLPIFSAHVYYNSASGAFEHVAAMETATLYNESTVYITDDCIMGVLDSNIMLDWVIQNRLSLFAKSDLWNEYRLLSLLVQSSSEFISNFMQTQKEKIKQQQSTSATTSENELPKITRRVSKRSATLSSRRHKLSTPFRVATSPSSRRGNSGRSRSATGGSAVQFSDRSSDEIAQLSRRIASLTSKAGMKEFRDFLSGTNGERKLLYWLDVEQYINCDDSHEKMKLLKDIRERYFSSTSSLSLGDHYSESMKGSCTLSEKTLLQLRDTWMHGLTKYWYPRFLIHSLKPFSVTKASTESRLHIFDRCPHPSKTAMPVIKRVGGRLKTPTISHRYSQSVPPLFDRGSNYCSRPWTTQETSLKLPLTSTCTNSRLLWSRDSYRSSSVLYNKLAKYNEYPVIPSGRSSTTSLLLEQTSNLNTNLSEIISVSGTPVPLYDSQQTSNSSEFHLLMKCLAIERRNCGGYFQKFLEKQENKVYVNCLMFWRDVQQYKSMFFGSDFNPSTAETKAKVIYGLYILATSQYSINCPANAQTYISQRLWPAYEDVFDIVEEYTLSILMSQWLKLCELDNQRFEQSKCLISNCLEMDNVLTFELDKLSEESNSQSSLSSSCSTTSSQRENEITESDSLLNNDEDGSTPVLVMKHEVTEEKEMSFNNILTNPKELEFFKIFLNNNNAAADLMCWFEIESFRSLPFNDKVVKNLKAKQIRTKYFNKKYFFGSNSPASKEVQREVVSAGGSYRLPSRPKSSVFCEAQKHIRSRLEKKWVPLFTKSEEFIERHGGEKSTSANETAVEDGETASVNVYMESHETLQLKKALYDVQQREVFKEFITLQASEGTCPVANVDFWLEIQRFKNMFHFHMNPSIVREKVKAIISCYIKSQCEPVIQVNIPSTVAEELTKKPTGPYMFRESQSIVFRYLQTCWQEYQSFVAEKGADTSLSKALKNLKDSIAKQREREQEMIKLEERSRMSLLHFETEAEKLKRLAKEKELKEFGEVSVSFRLSAVDPSVVYSIPVHTDQLPVTTNNIDSTTAVNKPVGNRVKFVSPEGVVSSSIIKNLTATRLLGNRHRCVTIEDL